MKPDINPSDAWRIAACGACDWQGPLVALAEIKRAEHLRRDEPMPAGECPNCGALAYLD